MATPAKTIDVYLTATAKAAPDSKSTTAAAAASVVYEVIGDLFAGAGTTASLGHCVSRCLAMGKGIAVLFKSKFGSVAELKSQNIPIGGCGVLQRDGRFVYYLVTKELYFNKPTYASLEQSLNAVRMHCVTNGVKRLCLPRIGCGLDGLSWPTVRAIIAKVFTGTNVTVNIYVF